MPIVVVAVALTALPRAGPAPDTVDVRGTEPEPGLVQGREVPVLDLAPELDADRVEVSVDGEPTPVELLQWYFHRVPGDDGDVYMPVALVQAVRPALDAGPHVVRVRVRDATTGALGEAVTWFTSNDEGFGF